MAQTFKDYRMNADVTIFASGVSNSLEDNQDAFDFEMAMVKSQSEKDAKFVYFSTCSIEDPSRHEKEYVNHKLNVEQFIQEHFDRYFIFRLPIIVGKSENPHTLTNFFYNQIVSNNKFKVYRNACRYLIDVDHVKQIADTILATDKFLNQIISVSLDNRVRVQDLVEIFETVLSKKANCDLVDSGVCYSLNGHIPHDLIREAGIELTENYNLELIQKYYGSH